MLDESLEEKVLKPRMGALHIQVLRVLGSSSVLLPWQRYVVPAYELSLPSQPLDYPSIASYSQLLVMHGCCHLSLSRWHPSQLILDPAYVPSERSILTDGRKQDHTSICNIKWKSVHFR